MTSNYDAEIQALKRRSRSRRNALIALALSMLVIFVTSVFLLMTYFRLQDTTADQGAVLDRVTRDINQICNRVERGAVKEPEAVAECRRAEPEKLPQIIREIEGERGPRGLRGREPTREEIRSAVAEYCSTGRCTGPRPTQEQVQAAVAAYCTAGRCQGDRGEAGAAGEEGSQGPGPSQAQIQAAVAAYCVERNQCSGPRGEPGQDGSDGQDGADGSDGQDGVAGRPPSGFSFTYDGVTYECTPDSPPEPGATPHYTCRAPDSSEEEEEGPVPPLGRGPDG